MKTQLTILLLSLSPLLVAQAPMNYENDKGDTHICGPLSIEDLQAKPHKKWFDKGYEGFELSGKSTEWKSLLENVKVEIYLGTWCGDSKRWVPKFVKLWDDLGLDRNQLAFIGLYDGDSKYKQGPNGEEKGKGIHRVPTIIFEKDEKEIGRLVERPVTDLETDIAQIALGYPSSPNYKAATYLLNQFDSTSLEEIQKDTRTHLNAIWKNVGKSSELNTLGYVLLRAKEIEKALFVFRLNTRLFPTNPNVFDSYGEALAISGDKAAAIENYEKVLKLDPANKNAKEQLNKLKSEG